MQVTAIITPLDIEEALSSARQVGAAGEISGLAAPLDGVLLGRLGDAWEAVEHAIRESFARGMDAARGAVDAAVEKAQSAIEGAGARAADLREALSARIQDYLARMIDKALAKVRTAVVIGARELSLAGVEIGQTIRINGSLKASIQEICSVTSEGEVSLTAQYGSFNA